MGHGGKIGWLITVWELQVQSKPEEHHTAYDIMDLSHSYLGGVNYKTWVRSPLHIYIFLYICMYPLCMCVYICEHKWESAVHLNLPSTTPLPIPLLHVVGNTLRLRWCIETDAVVLLRKAGLKWIVYYQIHFSIFGVHHSQWNGSRSQVLPCDTSVYMGSTGEFFFCK